MTSLPIFGTPPSVRALLLGTTPYAGSLPRDLYAALGFFYPGILSSDDEDLLLQCGGSRVLAELLRGLWTTAGQALDDLRGVGGQAFVERVATASEILHRLLDARPAVDIELDFYSEDAVLLLRGRLDALLSLAGDVRAVARMPPLIWHLAGEQNKGDQAEMLATAVGASLLGDRVNLRRKGGAFATPFAQWRDYGRAVLARNAYAPQTEVATQDAAGIKRLQKARPVPAPAPGSAVVFPGLSPAATGKADNQKEIRAALGDALGALLDGVPVPADWDAWEAAVVARWPHMPEVPRAIREAQSGRSHWGRMVICLVGPAGIGKTAIGRFVAESSGLPFSRFNADNSTDNSYGGTSIRWNSGHLGNVPAMLAEHLRATGLAQVDEVEKASGYRGSNGGRLHDTLHGLWDAETSSRWQCPFSAMPLDLSHVAYLATANSLDGIPPSLRDRMRIVEVRAPGPEHLAALVPQVAEHACRAQGLDPAWGALDSAEWGALRQAWGAGGSIRRLQQLLSTILWARDADPSLVRH
jgi:hypothetical protein